MAATARQIPIGAEDLDGSGGGVGGAYASITVPSDHEGTLVKVEDYDKRSQGKTHGWVFTYEVETPAGGTVEFKTYLSFGQNARWKLIEVLAAHDVDLSEGLNAVDPNALVGDVIGLHIDFPRNDEDQPTSKYREIAQFFSLAQQPEPEGRPVPEDAFAPQEEVVKFGEEPDII